MFYFLLVLFIVVCVLLCLLILIQSDKGGGISGAVGGLSGVSNFLGSQGEANVLTKGTYIFGTVFLLLCVLMAFFAPGGRVGSGVPGFVGNVQTVTPTPASGVMGFTEEAGDAPAAGGGGLESGGSGPTIGGEIIMGGVRHRMVDGELVPIEDEPESANP